LEIPVALWIGGLFGAPGAMLGRKWDDQGFETAMAGKADVDVFRFDALQQGAELESRFRNRHFNDFMLLSELH
jgi:hypothetical protein